MTWTKPAIEETPVGLEASGYFSPGDATVAKPSVECPGDSAPG